VLRPWKEFRIEPSLDVDREENRFYALSNGCYVYVIVTSPEYPLALAVEAIDELCRGMTTMRDTGENQNRRLRLWSWTKLSKDKKYSMRLGLCITIAKRYSLREPGCILYDYEMEPGKFQSYDNAIKTYLEIRDQQEWSDRMAILQEQTAMVEQQVRETFLQEVQNRKDFERINEKARDLLEQAQIFRERAAELRLRTKTKNTIRRIFTGVSVVVGGATFLLMGGLEQPFLFAASSALDNVVSQGIETAIGSTIAGTIGYIISPGVAETYFWSRKKVLKLRQGFGVHSRMNCIVKDDAEIPELAPTQTQDSNMSDDLATEE
jgi:hypothetical protein